MANVIFKRGTKAQYEALASHDSNTLYWLTDVQELRVGDVLFGIGKQATAALSGLMSAEDKAKLDDLAEGGVTGEVSAEDIIFESDLVFTQAFGRYTPENGKVTVPAAGKSWYDVLMDAYSQDSDPNVVPPSVTLTAGSIKAYEVGTKVTPSYSAVLDPGSYGFGPATGITASAWSVTNGKDTKNTASGSFDEITVEDNTNYSITATATYEAGAIPVTALGNECPAKQIAAGSASATKSKISGYRSYFYGVLDTVEPLTSDIIRGMTNGGAYNGSKTFTLNGSATAKRIVIAIPSASTRGGLSSVILTSAMNTPVTDSYVKTAAAVQVEGVNGYTAVDYDVYVYQPASIDAGEVHKITLA